VDKHNKHITSQFRTTSYICDNASPDTFIIKIRNSKHVKNNYFLTLTY